jgi:hypothetical protein
LQACSAAYAAAARQTQTAVQRSVVQPGELTSIFRSLVRINLVVLCLSPLIFAAFFTFVHLGKARFDLNALQECNRRQGPSAADCADLYGTYDQIVEDCEGWPPLFAERLCAIALPDEDSL